MTSVILRISHLSKRFGNMYVLQDVNMDIPFSKIVLLIGPNGSGKTTMINCISGVHIPDSGNIIFNNIDITGKSPHEIVKLGIGRSFQIPLPFKKMSVAENLLISGQNNPGENFLGCFKSNDWKNYEKTLLRKMFNILKIVGLEEKVDSEAEDLSGGQLKLLELARLLMLDVKFIMLDEPLGGVNPFLATEILNYIKKIRDEFKTTFLIVEHRLDIVMDHVDYVYLLSKGTVVAVGTPKDIAKKDVFYETFIS